MRVRAGLVTVIYQKTLVSSHFCFKDGDAMVGGIAEHFLIVIREVTV